MFLNPQSAEHKEALRMLNRCYSRVAGLVEGNMRPENGLYGILQEVRDQALRCGKTAPQELKAFLGAWLQEEPDGFCCFLQGLHTSVIFTGKRDIQSEMLWNILQGALEGQELPEVLRQIWD